MLRICFTNLESVRDKTRSFPGIDENSLQCSRVHKFPNIVSTCERMRFRVLDEMAVRRVDRKEI